MIALEYRLEQNPIRVMVLSHEMSLLYFLHDCIDAELNDELVRGTVSSEASGSGMSPSSEQSVGSEPGKVD